MKQEAAIKKNIVPLLFLLSVAVRFLLGNFYPRTINCYPDELLYLSGASSFWNQHQMLVFQMPSNFARIGYCLLIAPAFALSGMKARGMVIALINAVLVSLGLFPVYGIARRVLKDRKDVILSLMLYMICPTLTYSMTYMSENLYLPVALFFVYACYRFFEEENKKKKIFMGMGLLLLSGIAYMVKSVALAFPVALVMLLLTEMVTSKERKKCLLAGGIFVVGVLCAVAVLKLGLIEWDAGVMQGRVFYVLFGFAFFVLTAVLAFCVIPVLLPGLCYKDMEKNQRKLYLLCVYLILATALVVAAMIYVTEDYPSLTPRAHVRYVEFLFLPFVILVLRLMEEKREKIAFWKNVVVYGLWAVLQLVVFQGFSGQTVDHTMLFYWQLIAKEGKYFSAASVRILSLLIIIIVFALVLLYEKKRQLFRKVLLTGICIMCVGNSALSIYVQYKTHTHGKEETTEAETLRNFVRENNDKTFWVLEPEGFCELIDTYLIDCENVRTGTKPVLSQRIEKFNLPKNVDYMVVYDGLENSEYFSREDGILYQSYPSLGYSLYQLSH